MTKFVSWNVNGLRAICGKGFADIFADFDADFFCLQEIKLSEGQLDLEFEGYESFWNYADRKGYSGTAIFARRKPLSVRYGFEDDAHNHEGRAITLEYPDFYLVTVYVPNSQDGLARIGYRCEWEDAFRGHLEKLNRHKPVIICGDLNVAHKPIDLTKPKDNEGSPGYSVQEREKFGKLLDVGFVDSFRALHPDQAEAYTWWSYRMRARARNIGWRIDYFLISERLLPQLQAARIHADVQGSDHCPVSIELDV